jgi:uncharacterized membrane protein
MNGRIRKRSNGVRIGAIPLLALLLAGGVLAALSPQAAMAQQGRQDLSLRLVSRSNYAEITAGESKVLLLEVKNVGTTTIDGVELSALQPEGWTVDFDPDRIASLGPEDSQVVEVTLHTPPKSTKERHEVILRADSDAVHRALSVWMTVEAREGMWLWVGGILAVLVAAGFALIFWRFGRDS